MRATHYDLVLNGVELGSGSLRNHRSDVQLKILELLGYSEEQARERFGFMLEALDTVLAPDAAALVPAVRQIGTVERTAVYGDRSSTYATGDREGALVGHVRPDGAEHDAREPIGCLRMAATLKLRAGSG